MLILWVLLAELGGAASVNDAEGPAIVRQDGDERSSVQQAVQRHLRTAEPVNRASGHACDGAGGIDQLDLPLGGRELERILRHSCLA